MNDIENVDIEQIQLSDIKQHIIELSKKYILEKPNNCCWTCSFSKNDDRLPKNCATVDKSLLKTLSFNCENKSLHNEVNFIKNTLIEKLNDISTLYHLYGDEKYQLDSEVYTDFDILPTLRIQCSNNDIYIFRKINQFFFKIKINKKNEIVVIPKKWWQLKNTILNKKVSVCTNEELLKRLNEVLNNDLKTYEHNCSIHGDYIVGSTFFKKEYYITYNNTFDFILTDEEYSSILEANKQYNSTKEMFNKQIKTKELLNEFKIFE